MADNRRYYGAEAAREKAVSFSSLFCGTDGADGAEQTLLLQQILTLGAAWTLLLLVQRLNRCVGICLSD